PAANGVSRSAGSPLESALPSLEQFRIRKSRKRRGIKARVRTRRKRRPAISETLVRLAPAADCRPFGRRRRIAEQVFPCVRFLLRPALFSGSEPASPACAGIGKMIAVD